jgi:holliday junction DNA helicase RuvB
MPTQLRLVPDAVPRVATADDSALRPASFDDYVGQIEVISNLRQSVRAAKRGGWQLDHMLFAGPAGLGKTTLSQIIANELGGKLHATSAPAIEHKGALASLLTALAEGDVLFIDEIHALKREIAECLYSAMEDRVIDLPAGKRVIRVPLPTFTLLGATTHAGKLPKPLLDRFGFVWQLRPYTLPEMTTIVARSAAKLGVAIDGAGAETIARASRGTPRIANRLLRRVRDFAEVRGDGKITKDLADYALERLEVDPLGLDAGDRKILSTIIKRFDGGPVGIDSLAASLAEDRDTLEFVYEPYLIQEGFLIRTPRGRQITKRAYDHLGVPPPTRGGPQGSLF